MERIFAAYALSWLKYITSLVYVCSLFRAFDSYISARYETFLCARILSWIFFLNCCAVWGVYHLVVPFKGIGTSDVIQNFGALGC